MPASSFFFLSMSAIFLSISARTWYASVVLPASSRSWAFFVSSRERLLGLALDLVVVLAELARLAELIARLVVLAELGEADAEAEVRARGVGVVRELLEELLVESDRVHELRLLRVLTLCKKRLRVVVLSEEDRRRSCEQDERESRGE
jgi:hypothetical protein